MSKLRSADVFGPNNLQVGRIDEDEFVRNGPNLLYRIDGDEVYSMDPPGQLIGYFNGNTAKTLNGRLIFFIVPD